MLNDELREKCSATIFHPPVMEDGLLRRVRGEFTEMPGMRLTVEQAMRLWDLDRMTCSDILGWLVAAHFLQCDPGGRYARTHAGY
jgi:hypothetical protein